MVIYTCVKRRTESCFSLSCWFWGPGCFLFFCLQSLHFQWNDYCISQLVSRCQSLPRNRSSANVWKLTRVSAFLKCCILKDNMPKSQSESLRKIVKILVQIFSHEATVWKIHWAKNSILVIDSMLRTAASQWKRDALFAPNHVWTIVEKKKLWTIIATVWYCQARHVLLISLQNGVAFDGFFR